MTKKKTYIWLSASSVTNWFAEGCPAAWKYGREFRPIEDDEASARGEAVHAMLAGELNPATVEDRLTLLMYEKIEATRRGLGIKLIRQAEWQEQLLEPFEIIPGVMWNRKPDALGKMPNYDQVVIDWKSGAAWKVIQGVNNKLIAPQSRTFQAVSYLIPPPGVRRRDWPSHMVFVTGPMRGNSQIFHYEYKKEDHTNLISALHLMKYAIENNLYPKVRGKWCVDCWFQRPCFGRSDWRVDLRRDRRPVQR